MNRYKFLDSIHLGMTVTKDIFVRIYGFDLSFPGFRDFALNKLNQIGYHDAWKTYAEIVTEYENQQSDVFKKVANSATKKTYI